jgi:hypothetical protein
MVFWLESRFLDGSANVCLYVPRVTSTLSTHRTLSHTYINSPATPDNSRMDSFLRLLLKLSEAVLNKCKFLPFLLRSNLSGHVDTCMSTSLPLYPTLQITTVKGLRR